MEFLDWVVVAGYFVLVFGVAIFAGIREKKADSKDFFLAGRNVGWFVIGGSLFASNIGSEHLVGLAGTGAASGVAVAQFEILAGLILLLLGWLFVPFYLRSGVFTMPEFLEKRYSEGPRLYLAIISIIGYVLTKISVTIAAGGIVFEALMGIDFWTGALIVVVATGVYTIWGGLRAVLYTDVLQMFVLLFGAVSVTWLGLSAVGGWGALRVEAGETVFSLWRPLSDPDFPWTGILFGAPILGVWYWCTDQYIVQRVLSAHGIEDARRGTIFAAYLKQLPLFLFVVPGIIAAVLAARGAITLDNSDAALPTLVAALLPVGLKGLVVAGLLAALMSSLSSVFNSCSTIVTMDIFKRFRPHAEESQLVLVGRLSTGALVILGLLWIPFISRISGQIYTYLQSIQAYISPPIAAVFLVGILWSRANARGAAWALFVGFVLGVGRLVLELSKAHLDGIWLVAATANFLHVAIVLFLLCVAVLVGVSLLLPEQSVRKSGLTFATVFGSQDATGRLLSGNIKRDIGLSVGVLAVVAMLWIYFS
ncbi:solute:sodium symporter (SSS) family transporter [Iodidimonas muriae]|uniref:Solute:sodium symporter (SSS) family transporter n=1 Tax=Iodidimonas muriae TaxID=261467 RepID=A0ABQ2LE69_9PROT|nr:sodium:solute symporter [Iodidimonas muriae]GER07953.1 solute:sodium symporter (SSS) family transporter [Kordiimonadales bacterium JCM 17843]GGO11788.1 solute:sodium symporter (SSS) family transporter [Iodidimonas muriae]